MITTKLFTLVRLFLIFMNMTTYSDEDDDDLMPVSINGILYEFAPDSGSDVDIITTQNYFDLQSKLNKNIYLKPVTKLYRAANRSLITFRGYFSCKLSSASTTINTKVYVLDLPPGDPPLLSKKSLKALGLIKFSKDGGFVKSVSKFTKPHVECKDPQIIKKLDLVHERYRKVFIGLGKCKNYEVDLQLTEDAQPFFHRAAPVPLHLKDAASERIKTYVRTGIFVPVPPNVPLKYVSALLVIDKGNGKVRLVGNYCKLNTYLRRAAYVPAPRVEDFLDKMRGSRYFAKADITDAFTQLPLSKKSQQFCTLSTHIDNFTFTRMAQGLKNSQDFFDQKIGSILAHCQCVHNRDDILLGHSTLEGLLEEYEKVLAALEANGFTLDPKKTFFGLTEIKYYGFVFDKHGIRPDPAKVQALRDAVRPDSQDGLNSFICCVGYNARFILRFAEIVLPLRHLALSVGPMEWSSEHEKSFQYLKSSLCENTLNNYFVKGRPTAVHTDAGKKAYSASSGPSGALSAVLTQFDVDTKSWLPIMFASKTLTDVQTRYSQVELESVAIRWSCEKYRMYLAGSPKFTIFTDCKPLVNLFMKIPDTCPPRILRQILAVQDLDYVVEYKSGKLNLSDFCSRNPPPVSPKDHNDSDDDPWSITDDLERLEKRLVQAVREHPDPITMNTIRDATLDDSDLQFLLERMRRGDHDLHKKDARIRPFRSMIHELSEVDDIIFRGSSIIILPQRLWDDVVNRYHAIGHTGETNLLALIKESFYWPGMYHTVRLITTSCPQCGQTKISKRKEPYGIRPTPTRIFD